ncbi:MAG: portal protein, partial [Actinobacteria bacterium]|nr:portal protein [Actinomycetota bacterium]
ADDGRLRVQAGEETFEADNVVVAMSSYQRPWKPAFADELDPSIR